MAKPLTSQQVKDRLLKVHGDTVLLDESTYKNASSKALFIDKDFGPWLAQVNHIISGHKHIKRGYLERKVYSVSIDEVKQRLLNVYGKKVSIDEITYTHMHTKARFIDNKYGDWWATPSNVLGGHGHRLRSLIEAAPKQSKTRKKMFASGKLDRWALAKAPKFQHTDIELAIEEELTNRGILFETQKVLFNKFLVDEVIEKYKIVLFADGCYWHGCPEHKLGFKDTIKRNSIDKSQTVYLTKCGYKVFRFWEHDIKKDVSACIDQVEQCIISRNILNG